MILPVASRIWETSFSVLMISVPSGLTLAHRPTSILDNSLPVRASQTRAVLSPALAVVTIRDPSELHAALLSAHEKPSLVLPGGQWPTRCAISLPVLGSHIRMVLSYKRKRIRVPSW